MSAPTQFDRSVTSYLTRQGWVRRSTGALGALWSSSSDEDATVIAVPSGDIKPDDREWRSVIERLAGHEHREPGEVATSIEYQFVDVTHLRAANDIVISRSIPLTAGATLVLSAKEMLRSSATTAQRARSQIDGNFSRVGDEIAKSARLGHTIEGSYIIPVLMPLPEMSQSDAQVSLLPRADEHRAQPESAERRVMRTFAEALTAVDKIVVEPARAPRQRDMPGLVVAGVSREFVSALARVLTEPAVAEFETKFQWAPAATAPSGVPADITIPKASVALLESAATLLRSTRKDPPQSITGPIVEVRYVHGDPFGEVAVQTIRGGRPSEIRVRLSPDDIDKSHEWMRTAKTVVVDGVVARTRGRPLRIDSPSRFASLDSTFLDGADE